MTPRTLRIVFGTEVAPDGRLPGGRSVEIDAGRGTPLRCHEVALDLPAPGTLAAGRASRRALFLAALERLCGSWDAAGRGFLARYFSYLDRCLAASRDLVAERLRPFAGLYAPADYVFGAPAPLPRAHWPIADGAAPVLVDFAFWPGGGAAVALARPSRLTPAAERLRLSRLAQAGARVEPFATGGNAAGDDAMFARLLGLDPVRLFGLDRPPIGPAPPAALAI